MQQTFWAGFEKQALNMTTARAAVSRIRPNIFRRNMTLSQKAIESGDPGIRLSLAKGKDFVPVGPMTNVKNFPGSVQHPAADRKIFAHGDTTNFLNRTGRNPGSDINPQNKEMTNRLMVLHEQAERKASRGKDPKMWLGSHADPKVILQEGNALATLPKGFEQAHNTFKGLREMDNTAAVLEEAIPNYEYGKTRLSRHAIKRVKELLNQKGYAPRNVSEIIAERGG